MDYEYSVIGSIFCNAETLATVAESTEFKYKNYTFSLRKFSAQISVNLRDNSADTNISKNILEADVSTVCKQLSEKYACKVAMRKGYEVYGNANVFNGGSDYEVIEEKWFTVEFNNGVQTI